MMRDRVTDLSTDQEPTRTSGNKQSNFDLFSAPKEAFLPRGWYYAQGLNVFW
jgi:hypothetical protein